MQRIPFLNGFHLKLIAICTMFIDHLGYTLFPGDLWLRCVGRVAFPIFCFLIAEGCVYTHDRKKYALRLLVFALLSEIPFNLMNSGMIWDPYDQNVLWTLLLGAAMIACMKRAGESPWRIGLMVPFALAAEGLGSSYGGWGIVMIALFWLTREIPRGNWLRLAGLAVINWSISSMHMSLLGLKVPVQAFGVLAMIPIWAYSGEKRTGSKALAWGFYLFYPVHLLALYWLRQLVWG